MYVCHVYVGGCLGVGACPAVGVGNPAGSGGGRLGCFDVDMKVQIHSIQRNISAQTSRVAGLWILSTQTFGVLRLFKKLLRKGIFSLRLKENSENTKAAWPKSRQPKTRFL